MFNIIIIIKDIYFILFFYYLKFIYIFYIFTLYFFFIFIIFCLFVIIEYGSMLSCSTENHVNSIENIKTDHFIHKFETDDVLRENMSENAVLPSHDSLTDHDLHWEMNYHEAAIFLEVYIILSSLH